MKDKINEKNKNVNSEKNCENDFPNEMSWSMDSLLSYNQADNFKNYTQNNFNLSDCSVELKELDKTWSLNYHEAAIYLQEGLNNDKFDFHPKTKETLSMYLVVHNSYFYLLDLFVSLLLLFLVVFEKPAVDGLEFPLKFHVFIELFALTILAIELFLKLRWMKFYHFIRHTRTSIKLACLIIMFLEVLFVNFSNSYFRLTRILRPVFLIDNFYCGSIRRFIRQVIQSLPPILDMLILLFFFITISSLCSFYLFSSNPNDPNFKTLLKSFISLFILLTTANFPDVMMPAYYKTKYSSLFFVVFLIISLYLLMNLMLAVVYEVFIRIEKDKFRKLLLHRKLACKHAFRLLVTKSSPKKVPFKHFCGMLRFYNKKISKLESYLLFKSLDTKNNGRLSLEQFYDFYEFVDLKWVKIETKIPFYMSFKSNTVIKICNFITKIVKTLCFDVVIYILISLSILWQLFDASQEKIMNNNLLYFISLLRSEITIIFICLFTLEVILKIIAFGLHDYLNDYWNFFDFIVTISSIFGLMFESFNYSFSFVYIFRCVRLLKIFELKKRYRDIMGTFMYILTERFLSVTIVILIVFYSFAILGIELFSSYDLHDCCLGTEYSSYFKDEGNGTYNGYYFLNNFDNIAITYVTLFQLMVANNWQVIMEGYSIVFSPWSRLYFIIFYLVTMIVMTIIVAFVLEAFLFRIQYKTKLGNIDKDTKVIRDISINQNEYDYCISNQSVSNQQKWKIMNSFVETGGELPYNDIENIHFYHGEKTRTKFLFSMKMYQDEISEWTKD